ncbi:hypothetical protein VCHA37P191_60171 [Vibrio chagasii]|nr:hypothetical protein VCHA37P191_60171 [Vibrio chagasii]
MCNKILACNYQYMKLFHQTILKAQDWGSLIWILTRPSRQHALTLQYILR